MEEEQDKAPEVQGEIISYEHDAELIEETSDALDVYQEQTIWPARVARVKRQDLLVMNRGSQNGIVRGLKVYVYGLDEEEDFDPETGESLGRAENIKGVGRVIHVQEKMSLVQSSMNPTDGTFYREPSGFWDLFFSSEKASEDLRIQMSQLVSPLEGKRPFDDPEAGDYIKPLPKREQPNS